MNSLPKRYRYKYVMEPRFEHLEHQYQLIGQGGGVHLHITEYSKDFAKEYKKKYTGGIECHFRNPPEYMENTPPTYDDCFLLKAPCWHDGSSLFVEEQIIPYFETMSIVTVFSQVVSYADSNFSKNSIRGE